MNIQESGQMYLETIYVLLSEKGTVRAIDVGEHMGYSKPSVSRAMGILKKEALINIDGNGHITLTEKGLATAKSIYERHTIISLLLRSMGVDDDVAAQDACRIEHCISEQTLEAIKKYIESKTDENGGKQ